MKERILGIGLSQSDKMIVLDAYPNYEFVEATTLAQARGKLDEQPRVRIVLLDIDSDFDGLISLYHTLMFQTENQNVNLLILGAPDRVAAGLDGAKPDPLALLPKPITKESLIAQVSKNMEAKLHVSESVLLAEQAKVVNTLFTQAPLAMMVAFEDGDGKRAVHVNTLFEDLLGYTNLEMKKINVETLVHPDDRAKRREAVSEEAFTLDLTLITKSGDPKSVTERTQTLYLNNGRAFAVASFFID